MTDNSRLDSLLKQMAEDHQPELPSPGLIWWRAQILRKRQEKDRIERPLIIMRWVATATCMVAFLWLIAENWSLLEAAPGNHPLLIALGLLVVAASLVSAAMLLWSPASKP